MKKYLGLALLSTMLFGCASANLNVSKPYITNKNAKLSLSISKDPGVLIPPKQFELIENQISEGLTQSGLLSSSEVRSEHTVTIDMRSFRMRDDAARLTVGILAGCDNINSLVTVTDTSTNEVVGKSEISIKECAAWGVAEQVIKKYTEGVVNYLSNKKGA